MARLILITGGARSGKSTYAEKVASKAGSNVLYIATALPIDSEMEERIAKHREHRPSHWQTIEAYRDLDTLILKNAPGKSAVLLDCVTVMLNNLVFDAEVDWETADHRVIADLEAQFRKEFQKLIYCVDKLDIPIILVTNELGMGLIPENRLSRIFMDIHGRINQLLASAAHEVFLCVSGIPLRIK
ncbi:MAG TPA: bifunctional adenosylcobinamide kinase/adenosylcobinamide-phosphate guanylyltransferase [Firmicutes bacterium]|jgi:adenosylcobinamide kinase / adenosylcobinamide-phosphate guanylyltransferase|nr:bifunctional adenosylcobinamide kinase/adenosylcobinamide-phosphate guanylyltransferase [Bacillota bacterium]